MPGGSTLRDGTVRCRRPDQRPKTTLFQGAVDVTFAAFGIDALYTSETRIHETAAFEVRASEVASPRPGDQLTLGGGPFIVQGEPERRDPGRLVWRLDVRPL
jgi:hypothetical protein